MPAAAGIAAPPATLTTTEASVLGLLALTGEASGYDLLKKAERSVAYI